ncbi:hypothetical protein AB0D59_45675 [Streptomyces sp. NPDC048417]|uniref:hypothetical protein n=1 Tax=Streptomyces sp. NPDC048417 TaxID=3155387 RepID=UPI0034231122
MDEEVSSTPLAWQGEATRRGAGIRAAAVVRSGLFAGQIAERIAEVSEHQILEDDADSAGYSKLFAQDLPEADGDNGIAADFQEIVVDADARIVQEGPHATDHRCVP